MLVQTQWRPILPFVVIGDIDRPRIGEELPEISNDAPDSPRARAAVRLVVIQKNSREILERGLLDIMAYRPALRRVTDPALEQLDRISAIRRARRFAVSRGTFAKSGLGRPKMAR